MVEHDPQEDHVQAVADSIRKVIDDPAKAEGVDRAVSAAMGDEAATDEDEPTPSGEGEG